ncbi:hypothetical protein V495_03390 [Pseudogymnoascus sp. VKM F-4514 (FW-929)]|nr:hypothetical protein V495_03390 [Pseudogymnoascus sp. VKM F-4514 (FW-929)]
MEWTKLEVAHRHDNAERQSRSQRAAAQHIVSFPSQLAAPPSPRRPLLLCLVMLDAEAKTTSETCSDNTLLSPRPLIAPAPSNSMILRRKQLPLTAPSSRPSHVTPHHLPPPSPTDPLPSSVFPNQAAILRANDTTTPPLRHPRSPRFHSGVDKRTGAGESTAGKPRSPRFRSGVDKRTGAGESTSAFSRRDEIVLMSWRVASKRLPADGRRGAELGIVRAPRVVAAVSPGVS